jgi:hypothetical protein
MGLAEFDLLEKTTDEKSQSQRGIVALNCNSFKPVRREDGKMDLNKLAFRLLFFPA